MPCCALISKGVPLPMYEVFPFFRVGALIPFTLYGSLAWLNFTLPARAKRHFEVVL